MPLEGFQGKGLVAAVLGAGFAEPVPRLTVKLSGRKWNYVNPLVAVSPFNTDGINNEHETIL